MDDPGNRVPGQLVSPFHHEYSQFRNLTSLAATYAPCIPVPLPITPNVAHRDRR